MNKIEQAAIIIRANPRITITQLAKKLDIKVPYAYAIRSKALKATRLTSELGARPHFAEEPVVEAAEALNTSPLAVQVGGEHYKNMAIQPIQFITANNLGSLEGCIVKRISRWRSKDGIQDLQKIKHEVDLLIAANS
jgi:hypothetical protein